MAPGELRKVHPEELVLLEDPGEHHLEANKVGTLAADHVKVHRVVHAAHLQHLQRIGGR